MRLSPAEKPSNIASLAGGDLTDQTNHTFKREDDLVKSQDLGDWSVLFLKKKKIEITISLTQRDDSVKPRSRGQPLETIRRLSSH